jgi:hypothetical protein
VARCATDIILVRDGWAGNDHRVRVRHRAVDIVGRCDAVTGSNLLGFGGIGIGHERDLRPGERRKHAQMVLSHTPQADDADSE